MLQVFMLDSPALRYRQSIEPFLAALAGALVGGAASTIGALIVARRSQARAHRVRIYDELLPSIMKYVPQKGWPARTLAQLDPDEYRELLDPIIRSAHVIGGDDATRVDAIHESLVRWAEIADTAVQAFDEEEGTAYLDFPDPAAPEDFDAANREFVEAIRDYREWLRRKLEEVL